MIAELRLPPNFTLYTRGSLYSNFDKELDLEIAYELMNKPLAAEYTANFFHGLFWWNEHIGFWCIEIWQNRCFVATHIATDINDLIEEIHTIYGGE